jgi:hypothetical protein
LSFDDVFEDDNDSVLIPHKEHLRPTWSETSMDDLCGFPGKEDDDDLGHESSNLEHIFPWKLHDMLADAERGNFQDSISWVQDGRAFKVHRSDDFVEKVMPNYFDQTKYESFRRQLNLYGFQRVSRGEFRGIYSHPFFIRRDRSLCQNISRRTNKILPTRHKGTPSVECTYGATHSVSLEVSAFQRDEVLKLT